MGYLFAQTWIWIAAAFVLGLVIGFGLAWVSRKKKVEVTQERITGTSADGPTPLYVGDGRLAGTLGAATLSNTGGRHAAPDPDETIRRTPQQQGDADPDETIRRTAQQQGDPDPDETIRRTPQQQGDPDPDETIRRTPQQQGDPDDDAPVADGDVERSST